jgi:hypothetical protein
MKKLIGLSQLEEARSGDYAVLNITSFNQSADFDAARCVVF